MNFKADKTIEINDTLNFKQINELIDKSLPSLNNIYAIKITGTFKAVKTRSEFKQTKPYNNLGDVLKHQVVFNLGKVQGTMVGFRFPKYLNNVNVPGYHFHFLTSDKKAGGHALGFVTQNVKIEIEYINNLEMRSPGTEDFENTGFIKGQTEKESSL